MSDKDECLFIGGPKDGERMRIPAEHGEVMIPCTTPESQQDAIGYTPTRPYQTAVYRRETLASAKTRIDLFVHESLSVEQLLALLVQNYHPTPPRD